MINRMNPRTSLRPRRSAGRERRRRVFPGEGFTKDEVRGEGAATVVDVGEELVDGKVGEGGG